MSDAADVPAPAPDAEVHRSTRAGDAAPLGVARARYVGVATGVDAVRRLLDVWDCWRRDPAHCDRLTLIAIVPDLDAARVGCDAASGPIADLAARLAAAWPVATPGLHALGFDAGRVGWLLAAGTVESWLPRLGARVDSWRLGADVAAASPRVGRALARLSARGARLVAPPLPPLAATALRAAGFAVETTPSRSVAVFAPRFEPRQRPGSGRSGVDRRAHDDPAARILVVGAGLAGCAAAWALAEQGRRCTVFERLPGPAQEASGNVAGLFHGVVHAGDGPHARFNRAAALAATTAVDIAIERHGVPGSTGGALRLETKLEAPAMRALLLRLALPEGYVQALDPEEASACAGMALASPAWFYPGGGWVRPGGLARSFLERAGGDAELRTGVAIDRLEATPTGWRLLDAEGRTVDEGPTVVLANAGDAVRLLAPFGGAAWPVAAIRGQLGMVAARHLDFALPVKPVAGAGYLLPEVDGAAVFGATAHTDDPCADVRPSDHAANLDRLGRLLGRRPAIEIEQVQGRTAWRWSSRDRLPLIGGVPGAPALMAAAAAVHGAGPVRGAVDVVSTHRIPGLFVFTALGSRGITWAALGGQVLAARLTGSPSPLENALIDAVDPLRFAIRKSRSGAGGAGESGG